jgi:3-keto-L-gulonate-6-phosphate decarboxylase
MMMTTLTMRMYNLKMSVVVMVVDVGRDHQHLGSDSIRLVNVKLLFQDFVVVVVCGGVTC